MKFFQSQERFPEPGPCPRLDDEDESPETDEGFRRPVGAQIQRKFLDQRKIFLWAAVDGRSSAKDITEKMLYPRGGRAREGHHFLYINTPGGSITAGMAVY